MRRRCWPPGRRPEGDAWEKRRRRTRTRGTTAAFFGIFGIWRPRYFCYFCCKMRAREDISRAREEVRRCRRPRCLPPSPSTPASAQTWRALGDRPWTRPRGPRRAPGWRMCGTSTSSLGARRPGWMASCPFCGGPRRPSGCWTCWKVWSGNTSSREPRPAPSRSTCSGVSIIEGNGFGTSNRPQTALPAISGPFPPRIGVV